MKTLILSEHDVRSLLPMGQCIEVMESAFRDLASGAVHQPLRAAIRPEGAPGLLGLMPAWRGGASPLFGLKEVGVFPGNPAQGLDTHVGAVLLHSGDTGEILAILNASAITAIRTAAVSALATRLLSRPDSALLAIIGSGAQASSHLEALPLVRSFREIRLCGRREVDPALFPGVTHFPRTVEEAVRGADVVVTVTSSREPVLERSWIADGTHINAVGSSIASARELDGATVAASSLFVDRRESTLNESGDYLAAVREGAIAGPGNIKAELGEVLMGTHPGRTSAEEITLFKSLGLAIEDLAAAAFVYEQAIRMGVGVSVEL